MYFSIASLTIGLATACIILTAPDPVNGSLVPRDGPELAWSYDISPNTKPVAGDQQKAKASTKTLVNSLLESDGNPHLESTSPVFVGDPDHFFIKISSAARLGYVTCPCYGEARVDHREREVSLILMANNVHKGRIMKNWVNHWKIRIGIAQST